MAGHPAESWAFVDSRSVGPGEVSPALDKVGRMVRSRDPVTATELIAELERRRVEDPEYRAALEAREAERVERTRRSRQAEGPILADLAEAGIEVGTVWNLYRVPDAFPRAIPILLSHLRRDYPDRVLEGVGCALATKAAREWWPDLKQLYLQTEHPVVRDCLAAALSEVAVRQHYDDLLSFVGDVRLGETRIYFLRDINRIGNRLAPGTGRAVIESLADDPVLGKEATAILKGRGRND